MKNILINIGLVIIGLIIGSIVNMFLIILGGELFQLPEKFNAMNWEIKHFIFPFLAHAVGTFTGSFFVARIAKTHKLLLAIIIGIVFLSGGIYMVKILPAPSWFIAVDLILAYIPMAWLGWKIIKVK